MFPIDLHNRYGRLFGDATDPVLTSLRERLAADGWTLDPTTDDGYPFAHQAQWSNGAYSAMVGWSWPGRERIDGTDAQGYSLGASLCRGPGPGGGRLVATVESRQVRYGRPMTPEAWVDQSVDRLRKLKAAADEWAAGRPA